jgi:putative CocE/NonD family hydrolase
MLKSFYLSISLLLVTSLGALAQQGIPNVSFGVSSKDIDSPKLYQEIKSLAERGLAIYTKRKKPKLYTLGLLYRGAANHSKALATLLKNQDEEVQGNPYTGKLSLLAQILYAKTKAKQANSQQSFASLFSPVFQETYNKLSDKAKPWAPSYLAQDPTAFKNQYFSIYKQFEGKDSVGLLDAVYLCRSYANYQMYKAITPLVKPLLKAEDNKRYILSDSVMIKMPDGEYISAIVVRKKGVTTPLPTIFYYNIYAQGKIDNGNTRIAKEAALHGYVGVVAFPRGKRYSTGKIRPYETESRDAYHIIDWISKQKWNNGKVGMYGGSYCGFTQWAATKRLHPALKTIVPSAAVAPGLDVPMENNVFFNFTYNWVAYTTNNAYLDRDTYYDNNRWKKLFDEWYKKGTPHKDLDKIDGQPNEVYRRWLQHPSYDAYWQAMIPYQKEFAKINIPILSTTGYFDGGQISTLYYVKQHYKYRPNAEHYLLIGPWGHFGCQGFPSASFGGYQTDKAAQISIHQVIYQWFDYVLKGGKKPAILKDKINYQVMGANNWGHAASLDRMYERKVRFYLNPTLDAQSKHKNKFYQLVRQRPNTPKHIGQKVDFAQRDQQNSVGSWRVIQQKINTGNGLVFATPTFDKPMIISGAYTGKLVATINKKDMDCAIVLYEQTAEGDFFKLTQRYIGRASYAHNKSKRQLLTPGKKETIPFNNTRITARKLGKGSRLVMVLNVNKNRDLQINYGTGKEVSSESMKDAKTPLKVKWHNESYIDIPLSDLNN